MTDNPTSPVTFSAEERAMLDGTAEVKLEETTDGDAQQEGGAPSSDDKPPEQSGEAADGDKRADEGDPGDDGDEEVTEIADSTNPDGPRRRTVISFKAYDKERRAKQSLAEEAAKLREQVAYLSGLSQNAPQNAPKPQQQELSDTPPDKTKEPEKYLAWLESAAQEAIRIKRQSAQHSEQTTQFQQINQAVFDHEQAFINGDQTSGIEPHPDFNEAVKHLQNTHKAELRAAGYDANEIQQIMTARAQSVAVKALQQGKSPAERVYELAKLAGYKRAAPAKQETEAEKIARQAKSQEKAGKTISSLPGGESKGGLTADSLANMDPMAFKKLWDSGEAKALLGWKD
jgi:hypothetical protein